MAEVSGQAVPARDVQELWLQVHRTLRAFIAKRVANDAEVDDLLQEVFLRIHRRLRSLRDPQRLVSWVYQITRHAIADHYRAPARRRELSAGSPTELEAAHPLAGVGEPEDAGRLRAELAGCLRPMIARLSTLHREAVTLVELEGLTQPAAARRLGVSVSGLKSRVQRGRRQLKRMLEACCTVELDRRGGIVDYAVRGPACSDCGVLPTTPDANERS